MIEGCNEIKSEFVLKQEKLERDPACYVCRDWFKPILQIHHVLFLSFGGEDTHANTELLCPNCHKLIHYIFSKKYEEDCGEAKISEVFKGYLKKDEIERLEYLAWKHEAYRMMLYAKMITSYSPENIRDLIENGEIDINFAHSLVDITNSLVKIMKNHYEQVRTS